jgi:hypothetical protein
MSVILGAVVAIVLGLVVNELCDLSAWIAPRIVNRAVRHIPARLQDVRREEWLGELENYDGLKLTKLVFALGFWVTGLRLSFRYRAEIRQDRSRNRSQYPATKIRLVRSEEPLSADVLSRILRLGQKSSPGDTISLEGMNFTLRKSGGEMMLEETSERWTVSWPASDKPHSSD